MTDGDSIGGGRRYGSQVPDDRRCPICEGPLPSSRARFCGPACKQRAWRLSHARLPDLGALTAELRRRRQITAVSVYECPACQTRLIGERRCPDCNLMCRRVGLGAECPHCSEPIVIDELLP